MLERFANTGERWKEQTVDIFKSKAFKVLAAAAATGLIAASIGGLTGCQAATQQIAATVNGENIPESQITDYIQNYREVNDLTDSKAWAQWLVDSDRTAADMRDDAIDYYVEQLLVEQEATKAGITVSDEEVAERIAETKQYYGMDDAQFSESLKEMGYTEESYTALQRHSLLEDKIAASLDGSSGEITDADIVEQANSYAAILEGSKQLDVIAASTDKIEKAHEELLQGAAFEQVKAKYGETDEFDGWDVLTTQDQVVIDAITNMQQGAISDILTGTDHDYIVRVTQVLVLPENAASPDEPYTSVDQLPVEIKETFTQSAAENVKADAFNIYIEQLKQSADIKKNEMPKGLPYDVDLTGIQKTPEDDSYADGDEVYLDDGLDDGVEVDADGYVISQPDVDEDVGDDTDNNAAGNANGNANVNNDANAAGNANGNANGGEFVSGNQGTIENK
ncbi:MAG: hypothetical protein BZ138_06600 [Methanosphaera sp. rholeuAM270]|nr:MAG: hypothetical protein BZ138_06600 [Methanosphaera sp. rholeuAM270]